MGYIIVTKFLSQKSVSISLYCEVKFHCMNWGVGQNMNYRKFCEIFLKTLGAWWGFINLIKYMQKISTDNIIHNDERQWFSSKIRKKKRILTLPMSIPHWMRVSELSNSARKWNMMHPERRRNETTLVWKWKGFTYRKLKVIHTKLLEIINGLSNFVEFNINILKSIVFLYVSDVQCENEIKKFHF